MKSVLTPREQIELLLKTSLSKGMFPVSYKEAILYQTLFASISKEGRWTSLDELFPVVIENLQKELSILENQRQLLETGTRYMGSFLAPHSNLPIQSSGMQQVLSVPPQFLDSEITRKRQEIANCRRKVFIEAATEIIRPCNFPFMCHVYLMFFFTKDKRFLWNQCSNCQLCQNKSILSRLLSLYTITLLDIYAIHNGISVETAIKDLMKRFSISVNNLSASPAIKDGEDNGGWCHAKVMPLELSPEKFYIYSEIGEAVTFYYVLGVAGCWDIKRVNAFYHTSSTHLTYLAAPTQGPWRVLGSYRLEQNPALPILLTNDFDFYLSKLNQSDCCTLFFAEENTAISHLDFTPLKGKNVDVILAAKTEEEHTNSLQAIAELITNFKSVANVNEEYFFINKNNTIYRLKSTDNTQTTEVAICN